MDALLTAVLSAAALVAGGMLTWLTTRRTASGRIGTSEAGVLWDQAQAMRAELLSQRDKAIEQRDKLIDAQTSQVQPSLAAITSALALITDALARIESRQQQRPGG